MNTAVVKLDALTDSIRTATQDHDLLPVGYRILILRIIGGIIVSAVLCSADMNAFPCFFHTKSNPFFPDILLRNLQQLA